MDVFHQAEMAFHAPKIRYMLIYKEETVPTWTEMPFKANAYVRLDFCARRWLGNSGIRNMFRHFAQKISAAILLPCTNETVTVTVSLTNFIHFMRELCELSSPERIQSDSPKKAYAIETDSRSIFSRRHHRIISIVTDQPCAAHFFHPGTSIAIISWKCHKCILMHSTLYKFGNTSSVPASLLTLVAFYADN